jgi:hypothetical protein
MHAKLMRSLPLMVAAALAFHSNAQAEERACGGVIGAETVDNLRVPDSASCTLNATRVKGTIKVETGATLHASAISVVGNVQAENAAQVVAVDATVGGSIQVKQGGGADVTRTAVTGDIQYDHNAGPLNASRNRVGGNVQVVGNRARASIFSNTVDGNLQCKENSPAPVGGGNLVHGSAEDQCASFAGGRGAGARVPGGTGADRGAPAGAQGQRVLSLMSPFPVVRIAGRATRRGARIRLLTVRARPGASVRITCRGRGCPFGQLRKTISASVREGRPLPRTRLVRIRRLERRLLRPGATLRVFITAAGTVGKYTRFRIRTARTPLRTDMCLVPGSIRPLGCPSG